MTYSSVIQMPAEAEYTLVEEGTYAAVFDGITEPFWADPYKPGDAPRLRFQLKYRIVDHPVFRDEEVRSNFVSPSTWPTSSIYPHLVALLGRNPKAGEHVDFDALVGTPVIITITHSEGRSKKTNMMRTYANVTAVAARPVLANQVTALPNQPLQQESLTEPPLEGTTVVYRTPGGDADVL